MQIPGRARLVEFSFTSVLAAGLGEDELLRIARQSWRDNLRAGITGRLRIDGRLVDQALEGPAAAVLALSARILTDRRHMAIRVRALGGLASRRFGDWTVEGLGAAEPVAIRPEAAPASGNAAPSIRMLRLLPPVEPAEPGWAPARAALGSG